MKAIADRVLIKLDTPKEGNIVIVQTVYHPQTTGVVVSVGNEVTSVKNGDHVVFHAFDELPLIEKGLVAVRDKSILAILEE